MRQYDFCHSFPLVTGANPVQSHPTVPVQCLPWAEAWVWMRIFVSLAADGVTDTARAANPMAAEETAISASVMSFFFIVIYPVSCRAQLSVVTCYTPL